MLPSSRRIKEPELQMLHAPGKPETELSESGCWAAVVARDAAFDGMFYYSVSTTGVYCRPSCPSRRANRSNVRFHRSCAEAEAAGFRPCKRCKPNDGAAGLRHADKIAEACRLIEDQPEPLRLADIAAAVGLSPFHFHRLFKSIVGVTPKAYAIAHRQKLVRRTLKQSSTVTQAIHDAGFNASARFYETSREHLGMTPKAYRAGGTDAEIRFAIGDCSLGAILVAQSEIGICAILLGDDPEQLLRDLQEMFPRARLIGGDRKFEKLVSKVVGFVEAPGIGLDLPLDIRGTAFQHRVWDALRRIPAGTTVSYSSLAQQIGSPKAVRAVARACAANTIAVAIPCHRVVRNNGDLSGYRWGIARKRALLGKERK